MSISEPCAPVSDRLTHKEIEIVPASFGMAETDVDRPNQCINSDENAAGGDHVIEFDLPSLLKYIADSSAKTLLNRIADPSLSADYLYRPEKDR